MEYLIKILLFIFFNACAVLDIANSVKEFKRDRYYIGGLYVACALVLIYSSVEMMIITG